LRLAPRLISRQLQALCMILQRARKSPKAPADIVYCLSLSRAALDPAAVVDTAEEHIVAVYDSSHRELTYATDEHRQEALRRVFAAQHRAFRILDYTFAELRPLLLELYESRLLRPDFMAVADRLLAETSRA